MNEEMRKRWDKAIENDIKSRETKKMSEISYKKGFEDGKNYLDSERMSYVIKKTKQETLAEVEKMIDEKDLLEELSSIEHQQWQHWRRVVEKANPKIPRSEFVNIDYKDLDDNDKEFDRKWARLVLKELKSKLKEIKK